MTLFDELETTKYQPTCALCPAPATGWSGVEAWQDDMGAWIGWCSNDHRNRWLAGERTRSHQSHDEGAG